MSYRLRQIPIPFFSLLLTLVVFAGARTAAQETARSSEPTAQKFDEFEAAYGCDLGARLDNFAIQLQNEPLTTGYIITYGPEGEGSGSGEFRQKISENYLIAARGLEASRIKSVYGGRYKELKMSATEFWILPPGAEPPEPQKYENETKTFTGKFLEYNSSENVGMYVEDGPSIGNVTFAALADVLRQKSSVRAYVVAYNAKGAAPGAWRRAAKEVADNLQVDYKISAGQIEIVCGGYDVPVETGSYRIEIWVAPANASPPVAEAKGAEPVPDKAVRISSYEQFALDDETVTRQIFEGFADVLDKNERLSACVIIRPAKKIVEKTEDASKDTPAEKEPQVDMVSLVEGWKSKLEEKYGVSRNRLYVIVAPVEENDLTDSGSLETWIVPSGAQLPNPNEVEEESVETEEINTEAVNNPQE
ncbi:MAG TPA: hypothetical protein VGC66_03210 [Pyrinomonadaceae bacterium]|jgi:hypothetical protein